MSTAAPFHELTVDLMTFQKLEGIAEILGLEPEDALTVVIDEASYVFNSEALDRKPRPFPTNATPPVKRLR